MYAYSSMLFELCTSRQSWQTYSCTWLFLFHERTKVCKSLSQRAWVYNIENLPDTILQHVPFVTGHGAGSNCSDYITCPSSTVSEPRNIQDSGAVSRKDPI